MNVRTRTARAVVAVCAVTTLGHVPSAHATGVASDECAGGTSVYSTAGSDTLTGQLGYRRVGDRTTWICARVSSGRLPVPRTGGKFLIQHSALVTTGVDPAACATGTDVLDGAVGDPADPSTYVPYRLRIAPGAATASVCLTLGTTTYTATVEGDGATPLVSFVADDPTGTPQAYPASPSGSASSSCPLTYGFRYVETVTPTGWAWADLANDFAAGMASYTQYICFRASGAGSPVGGRISIHGVPAYYLPHASPADQCTVSVLDNNAPVSLHVSRSAGPDASGETWVCVEVAGTTVSLAAHVIGAPGTPNVEFTPDA